jgi:hypothetical protein
LYFCSQQDCSRCVLERLIRERRRWLQRLDCMTRLTRLSTSSAVLATWAGWWPYPPCCYPPRPDMAWLSARNSIFQRIATQSRDDEQLREQSFSSASVGSPETPSRDSRRGSSSSPSRSVCHRRRHAASADSSSPGCSPIPFSLSIWTSKPPLILASSAAFPCEWSPTSGALQPVKAHITSRTAGSASSHCAEEPTARLGSPLSSGRGDVSAEVADKKNWTGEFT